MKKINLLPKTQAREVRLGLASKQLLNFFIFIGSTLVILFAAALAIRFYMEGTLSQGKLQVDDLQKQLSSQNNQALEKRVVNLNTQLKNIKNISTQHLYWSNALLELGNLFPKDFHLDNLSVDRATGKIEVAGTADKREDVIAFWSNVKKSTYFTNINFPLTNLETETDTKFDFIFYINTKAIQK